MTTFIVAHTDFFDNKITLEKIEASSWRVAVALHSKYPFKGVLELDPVPTDKDPEDFKRECFDCDSQMEWIEI